MKYSFRPKFETKKQKYGNPDSSNCCFPPSLKLSVATNANSDKYLVVANKNLFARLPAQCVAQYPKLISVQMSHIHKIIDHVMFWSDWLPWNYNQHLYGNSGRIPFLFSPVNILQISLLVLDLIKLAAGSMKGKIVFIWSFSLRLGLICDPDQKIRCLTFLWTNSRLFPKT